jgi:hypothetical protein
VQVIETSRVTVVAAANQFEPTAIRSRPSKSWRDASRRSQAPPWRYFQSVPCAWSATSSSPDVDIPSVKITYTIRFVGNAGAQGRDLT